MDRLERLQNRALRTITGQLQSTPLEALHLEAGVQSYRTVSKRLVARSMEKALRCPADHPRRITAEEQVIRRTDRPCWRSVAQNLLSQLPAELNNRMPLDQFPLPPWRLSSGNLLIHPTVRGIQGRSDNPITKLSSSIAQIRSFNADITIYTDGSASAGTEDGGYAVIVTDGDAEEPNVLHTISKPGRKFTSSYEEEKAALHDALLWLLLNDDDPARVVLICTDSQSLCNALLGQNLQEFGNILCMLAQINPPSIYS